LPTLLRALLALFEVGCLSTMVITTNEIRQEI
jgi:hypothetical protein